MRLRLLVVLNGVDGVEYQFTRQKLKGERKAFMKRLAMVGGAGAAGLFLGVSMYDIGSLFGILSASALTTIAVFGSYFAGGIFGKG